MHRIVLIIPILLIGCSPQQNLASACGYGDDVACTALREGRTLPAIRPGAFVPAFNLDLND